MRRAVAVSAALVLAAAIPAFAVVGGGDVSLNKGKGGNVIFSHGTHVSKFGLTCKECHPALYLTTDRHKTVTMKQMRQGKSCGACHNGKKGFSVKSQCGKCHKK